MDQHNLETKTQETVDAGILEVVIALASLSVGIVALPMQIPNLVIQWFTIPIILFGIGTFIVSYMAFGDLFAVYLADRGLRFPGWWFGRETRVLQRNPYWEMWIAIRLFGISLVLLLGGMVLNWIFN